MVASLDEPFTEKMIIDEGAQIPPELHAHSNVFELDTIGDAREALARLRELRRDFDANAKRGPSAHPRSSTHHPVSLPGKGEPMLAGLSNIQRMRMIRGEIAYLEDLMVRIAAREFELDELRHQSYLAGIGQWTERSAGQRPMI